MFKVCAGGSPMRLPLRLSTVSTEFDLRAVASAMAPSGPIWEGEVGVCDGGSPG